MPNDIKIFNPATQADLLATCKDVLQRYWYITTVLKPGDNPEHPTAWTVIVEGSVANWDRNAPQEVEDVVDAEDLFADDDDLLPDGDDIFGN